MLPCKHEKMLQLQLCWALRSNLFAFLPSSPVLPLGTIATLRGSRKTFLLCFTSFWRLVSPSSFSYRPSNHDISILRFGRRFSLHWRTRTECWKNMKKEKVCQHFTARQPHEHKQKKRRRGIQHSECWKCGDGWICNLIARQARGMLSISFIAMPFGKLSCVLFGDFQMKSERHFRRMFGCRRTPLGEWHSLRVGFGLDRAWQHQSAGLMFFARLYWISHSCDMIPRLILAPALSSNRKQNIFVSAAV